MVHMCLIVLPMICIQWTRTTHIHSQMLLLGLRVGWQWCMFAMQQSTWSGTSWPWALMCWCYIVLSGQTAFMIIPAMNFYFCLTENAGHKSRLYILCLHGYMHTMRKLCTHNIIVIGQENASAVFLEYSTSKLLFSCWFQFGRILDILSLYTCRTTWNFNFMYLLPSQIYLANCEYFRKYSIVTTSLKLLSCSILHD